jgi:hypothetical protein
MWRRAQRRTEPVHTHAHMRQGTRLSVWGLSVHGRSGQRTQVNRQKRRASSAASSNRCLGQRDEERLLGALGQGFASRGMTGISAGGSASWSRGGAWGEIGEKL